MPATLRYALWIVIGAAVGGVSGLIVQLVVRQAGWWFVGLMAGAVAGAFIGYRLVTSEPPRRR